MPHAGRGQHRACTSYYCPKKSCLRLVGPRGTSDMGQGEQEPTTQEETQHGSHHCTQRGRILHRGGGITSGLAKAVAKDSAPPLPPRGWCPSQGATTMPGYWGRTGPSGPLVATSIWVGPSPVATVAQPKRGCSAGELGSSSSGGPLRRSLDQGDGSQLLAELLQHHHSLEEHRVVHSAGR